MRRKRPAESAARCSLRAPTLGLGHRRSASGHLCFCLSFLLVDMAEGADLDMLWEVVREGDRASIEALLVGVRVAAIEFRHNSVILFCLTLSRCLPHTGRRPPSARLPD